MAGLGQTRGVVLRAPGLGKGFKGIPLPCKGTRAPGLGKTDPDPEGDTDPWQRNCSPKSVECSFPVSQVQKMQGCHAWSQQYYSQ